MQRSHGYIAEASKLTAQLTFYSPAGVCHYLIWKGRILANSVSIDQLMVRFLRKDFSDPRRAIDRSTPRDITDKWNAGVNILRKWYLWIPIYIPYLIMGNISLHYDTIIRMRKVSRAVAIGHTHRTNYLACIQRKYVCNVPNCNCRFRMTMGNAAITSGICWFDE